MGRQSRVMAMGWGCCVAMLAGSLCLAKDWPQWRGPNRDGHVAGFVSPEAWPEKLTRQWKAEVGEGHASPVVVGDRVFVFGRQGEEEIVRAMSLADGREVWSQSYSAPYTMRSDAAPHGKGPKSTPVVSGGRLVTLGISGVLTCWDTRSGKLLWQHEFSNDFKRTWPLYGTAMSPVAERGY